MTLPLLVGEDNPYGSNPKYALFPMPDRSAGGRLCSLIFRLPKTTYVRSFDRVNLCTEKWSAPEARGKAAEILADLERTHVVLCGSKVAAAFGIPYEPYTVRVVREGRPLKIILLPHPSGRNRLWNEPGSFERAREALREGGVIDDAPNADLLADLADLE